MKVTSFDGLALSQYEIDDDIPLEFNSNLSRLPGQAGAFDHDGDEHFRQPVTISRSFELVESTYAAIDTALDALRAKANLGRRWLVIEMRDGSQRGCWAKLKQVQAPYKPEHLFYLPVQLTFEIAWPWFEDTGDIWYLDAGELLDDGLTFDRNYSTRSGAGSLTITNNGDDVIRRGLIVVQGASTNPKIENQTNGYSIQYTGTIPSGSILLIDIGAQQVSYPGGGVSNPYANITLGDNQVGFFRLELGANTINFTGGGTLEIHWAEVY